MPTLLCHVVWMPAYEGELEVFPAGHDEVEILGYGHEMLNFTIFNNYLYGYVQTLHRTININRLGADPGDSSVDGVTVIWTATSPEDQRVIVGWYLAARVFRDEQIGDVPGREFNGEIAGYYARARAVDSVLIPVNERTFDVPHHGPGLPGHASVFFPDDHGEIQPWLQDALQYISGWHGGMVALRNGATGRGWPSTPDAAHNAAVEAAAIACVRENLVNETADRQSDHCGWDLEFKRNGQILCVEVKGLSGTELGVELSPNEYAAMKRAMEGHFPEGDYRLAIVCNALTAPEMFLFAHGSGTDWVCEHTLRSIVVTERIAARLSG